MSDTRKIILIRHGVPRYDLYAIRKKRFRPRALRQLNLAYQESDINPDHPPSPHAIKTINSCRHIVCSELLRSQKSAELLGVSNIDLIDGNFNECNLPHANWHFPSLRLISWFYIYRLLWYLGYRQNAASYRHTRQRVHQGAETLVQLADKHESVALVGHGLVNLFVARYLRANGWQGPAKPGYDYWDYAVYEKP